MYSVIGNPNLRGQTRSRVPKGQCNMLRRCLGVLSKYVATSRQESDLGTSMPRVADHTAAVPGTGANAESSEHSCPEQTCEGGTNSVDWRSWWRKRLEADIETALQICQDVGDDTSVLRESTRQEGRVTNLSTQNDHLEVVRLALSELLGEPAHDADFAPAKSDSNVELPAAVSDRLDSLQGAFASLREDVHVAISRADRRDEIIDRLEEENRGLKRRETERRQEPLIKGVISLFDDLRSVARHAQTQAAADDKGQSELLQSLVVFERQALELLRRSHVESFEPTSADPFDATRQEAWETVETSSQDAQSALRADFSTSLS